jgi:hypothetical protein
MRPITKSFGALVMFALPVLTVFFTAGNLPEPDIKSYTPEAAEYAAGLALLAPASQSLIGVALSLLGGQAYMILNQDNGGNRDTLFLSAIAFVGSILSVYFAARIGYWSGRSVAAAQSDIQILGDYFEYQGTALLVAGSAVGATAFRFSLK